MMTRPIHRSRRMLLALTASALFIGGALGCTSSGGPPSSPPPATPAPSAASAPQQAASQAASSEAVSMSAASSPEFHYEKALGASKKLEIYGINGAIRATASSNTVDVRAIKRVKRGNPASQRIVVAEHPGGVVICVLTEGEPDQNCHSRRDGARDMQGTHTHEHSDEIEVTFEARIPAGIAFTGVTLNGSVDARGLRSDSELLTMNGSITAEVEGRIKAKTMNGAIVAKALGSTTPPVDLDTMNGSIELSVAPNANFQLSASTMSGHITSEFPVGAQPASFGPESLSATVGRGGVPIALRTMNGSITVRRAR